MTTVAVVGGGYGGVTVAKALDAVTDVVLIEPQDAFVHNVAALRAVVDPEWLDAIFLPYDRLLTRGRVLRDRAARVTTTGVELESGRWVPADYIVLATGSTVPFPAKIDVEDSETAKKKIRATREALATADRVLLVGAGAVGLEFAGEIKAVWPDKEVTIVERSQNLASGQFPEEFRTALRAQLDEMGIELLLGTSLRELPPSAPGEVETFSVTTDTKGEITADIWFACYGATVNTDYLSEDIAGARRPDNRVTVTPELLLTGTDNIFAVGDVTDVPEMKMARLAQFHAEVVAKNISASVDGGTDRASYEPAADAIMLPLGPNAGISYASEFGILGPEATAEAKSYGMFLDLYRDLLGTEKSG